MSFFKAPTIKLPASADFHVHLRDGAMSELVTPTIRKGGVDTAFVMPNLVPPLTTPQQALDYRAKLQKLEPNVNFLMSLYLHSSTFSETIIEAKKAGITGVKSYPAGVTTNSSSGVTDYSAFYPVFEEMERQDMILNLHGECPSSGSITIMSAESAFLSTLHDIHSRFPRLRIVLEHLTTAAAVDAVKACGPTVAGTITAHHLYLTIDQWAGDPHNFCKPVAKLPTDRVALLQAAVSGNSKFFFGSDSAPHPVTAKRGGDRIAAGVFTQPYTTQLVVDVLERAVEEEVLREEDLTLEKLEGFLGGYGRAFYRVGKAKGAIGLKMGDERVLNVLQDESEDVQVVPFRRGEKIRSLAWME